MSPQVSGIGVRPGADGFIQKRLLSHVHLEHPGRDRF